MLYLIDKVLRKQTAENPRLLTSPWFNPEFRWLMFSSYLGGISMQGSPIYLSSQVPCDGLVSHQ